MFDAWLDPAAVGRWLFATPTGESVRVEIDARVDGGFVVTERRGGVLAEHFGEYLGIDRPRRLRFAFRTDPEQPPSFATVEVRPTEVGCESTLTHAPDGRWAEYAERTRAGWAAILEGLDATLAGRGHGN